MAGEQNKNFNAMLHKDAGMPKIQIVTDEATIKRYGGEKMYFAPPIIYDAIMKSIPEGYLVTVGEIRSYLANTNNADFTDPMTAGIFVSIAAWASEQRNNDKTPYWRTLKTNGELNPKYPGGAEQQKRLLESEGHTIIKRGRTNIRYYVEDYETKLFTLV